MSNVDLTVEAALAAELRQANEWIGQLAAALAAAARNVAAMEAAGYSTVPVVTDAHRALRDFMASDGCSSELRATLEGILSR